MDEQNTPSTDDRHGKSLALLFSVFAIATCGLIYELLAGTIASYMLGDSVTQFSTIIGVYLFSMGLGSYLSRYFHKALIAVFIQIEILVGLIGGLSSLVLFTAAGTHGDIRRCAKAPIAFVRSTRGNEGLKHCGAPRPSTDSLCYFQTG